MKPVELRPPDIHDQKTIRLDRPFERINPRGGDSDLLQGGPEPPDRRRLRSNMVVVGVAGLLVFGSYALAEGQSFPCDPQYSYCYPGYGGYPRGYGGYPGGGHGGWVGFGGYGVHFGGFGAAGVNDGYSGG